MYSKHEIPAAQAAVYINGHSPAGKTVKTVIDSGQQRRALRKLLRDLVAFTGTAINELAATPRKTPQRKRQRLLYRRTNNLTDTDIDRLISEIGAARLMAALDRHTSPRLPLQAAQ